jgi:hypothetical protein
MAGPDRPQQRTLLLSEGERDGSSASAASHIHHAPIYASRLDQVERWFALLAQQMIGSADRLCPPSFWI